VSYNERAATLQRVWIAARHSLRDVFEQVSVADLAADRLPPTVERLTADDDAWQPH
jgi:DNA-binding IscR family transcriptional regulator